LSSKRALRATYGRGGDLELLEELRAGATPGERTAERSLERSCQMPSADAEGKGAVAPPGNAELKIMADGLKCLAGKDPTAHDLGPRARLIAASIDALFASREQRWNREKCMLVDKADRARRTIASFVAIPPEDPPRSEQGPGAAFHRMMHELGYQHFQHEPDVIALSEACCFDRAKEACEILRIADPAITHGRSPVLDASNGEYLKRLTTILFDTGHSDLAFRYAWSSLDATGNLKDGDFEGEQRINARGLYDVMLTPPPGRQTLVRVIYAEAAAGNLPDLNYDKAIAKFNRAVTDKVFQQGDVRREFARHLGAALAGAVNGDPELSADALDKFDKIREPTCRMLASDPRSGELDQIRNMAGQLEAWDYWRNRVPRTLKCRLKDPCGPSAACLEAAPANTAPRLHAY
jgi:hypothetical protein